MPANVTIACGQPVMGFLGSSVYLSPLYNIVRAAMVKLYAALFVFSTVSSLSVGTLATTIQDIQGPALRSPLLGQTVHNVTGIVTAKASNGFYITGEKSSDVRVSNGLFVFSSSAAILNSVAVGDQISLSGRVVEFRRSSSPNDLPLKELSSPGNITVLSSNNAVAPTILGKDRSPPTRLLSALDVGPDGYLGVPNNSSQISAVNATLQPNIYGLDFWQSLDGQLVTIPSPTATGFQNNFGEFWVYGNWPVTGKNGRGGMTITFGPGGIPDGNPETVIVGEPLDGTKNPQPALGIKLSDITGIVTYQFGFYYVRPLTAPQVVSRPDATIPPTTLQSKSRTDFCTITFGDYNVENLQPESAHLPTIASHIVDYLKTPDLLFLQEIQDNSGPTDDGTVSANLTLTTLVNAITSISGVTYNFTTIDPVNNQDGGQPGGNIRTAYLYRPEVLQLARGTPGGSTDAVLVEGPNGNPKLNFNPGRIDPTNPTWDATRKPLVAHWETRRGNRDLFTVNVHLSSKGGSSSVQGDARPPVNSPIENRTKQVQGVAGFVKSLLTKDRSANVIVAGDFNEFIQTRSVYKSLTDLLTDIDEAAGVPPVERYSYVFDQNSQQLDHVLISPAIQRRRVEFEHIHVNTWSPTLSARISDHDPSVGRIRLC